MPNDVAPPEAGEGEAPPAPAPAAEGDAPGGAQPVPDAGGTGVEPLLGRLKAAGASANDLDQVQRYYGSVDEVRGLKTRVSEVESDTYKDTLVADCFMADVDPDLHEAHRDWRQKEGDRAYNNAMKKQIRELAAERPDETPDEELLRRLDRLEKADKARDEKSLADQSKGAFVSDLNEILDGLKLKKEDADFLREDIKLSVDEGIVNATQLADFTQKRLACINAYVASKTKAAPPTPVVAEAPPPPSSGTSADKDGEPETIAEIVAGAAKRALGSSETGTGAS